MRTSPPRPPTLARDLTPSGVELERLVAATHGAAQRPATLRDTVVRWLNEEL